MESAKGHLPNLADAVAGVAVRGSWWKHPEAKNIFRATRLVRDSDDILVCRLIKGRITYVHRRLWPALVRLSSYLNRESLSAIREAHSQSGAHIVKTLPFPKWVPADAVKVANALSEDEAAAQLGPWATAMLRAAGPQLRSALDASNGTKIPSPKGQTPLPTSGDIVQKVLGRTARILDFLVMCY